MELQWEDHPVPDGPFFTKDLYDKYSLAPNVRELWTFLQSDVEPTKPSSSEAAELKDNSRVSCWESCDSDDPSVAEGQPDCGDPKSSQRKPKQSKTEAEAAFPEPRLPFPCMSCLSSKEQNIYLGFLTSKKKSDPPQYLQTRVNDEVMQFTRYLQDVAKICADDYNFISQGAMQYSEDVLRGCLEYTRTLPQLYKIHELTSLTGGTFNPELALTFEKQLLTLGKVNITDHQIVPADAQLASDYQSVSSENPPAKKAKDMHATISGDGNAEKLCACYEPHVCLTQDALVRLLDNHGPDFGEQWELPVCIKLNPGKGSSQKKTVYIDSPLLKSEMTVRQRSHIYHEESLKRSFRISGGLNMFHLLTELAADEQQHSQQDLRRNCAPLDSGIDFEVDITELETFGESRSTKTVQEKQDHCVKSKEVTRKTKDMSKDPVSDSSSAQDDSYSTPTATEDMTEISQPAENDGTEPETEGAEQDQVQEAEENSTLAEDSDDEKLVIDDSVSVASRRRPKPPADSSDGSSPPATQPDPENLGSPPARGAAACRRQPKRAKVSGDQLSEILRMQTAMLKSSDDPAKSVSKSPTQRTEPAVHSHHPTSLVKPCVSSYLERHQNEDGESSAASHEAPLVGAKTTEHKKILSQDLQSTAEDEKDYEAPAEGNLLYKLYSLQNVLLMVRSSVSLSHSRRVGSSSQNQFVPVHVLPKLEYQLSYGVECLTNSEVCRLWTETLLHSSTASYIAHISAHTSKVALLRRLPDNWKQSISCGFKLSKSLNILHHLLKKLTGLDEGRYLIAHKAGEPFVTLLRAVDGSAGRGLYDLQQVHRSTPQPPASGLLPWIPVDPAVVLDFHRKHGRVPCTFPPKQFPKVKTDGPSSTTSCPNNNPNTQGKKKNSKQRKRAAKRKKYINNLVQKSV